MRSSIPAANPSEASTRWPSSPVPRWVVPLTAPPCRWAVAQPGDAATALACSSRVTPLRHISATESIVMQNGISSAV